MINALFLVEELPKNKQSPNKAFQLGSIRSMIVDPQHRHRLSFSTESPGPRGEVNRRESVSGFENYLASGP